MKKLCGIYKITCSKTPIVYIGQSIDIKRRWINHKNSLKSNKHYNSYLQNIYNKYGEKTFKYEIICLCKISELDDLERFWINYYGGVESKLNCNFESGGHEHKHLSKSTREKSSKAHKGQRASIKTEFKKGLVPWNKGKKATKIVCERLRQSHLGYKVKEETKKKLTLASKGKRLGGERPNAQEVSCYDLSGNWINNFDSLASASRTYKVAYQCIRKAIINKTKCKGLYWRKGNKI